MEKSAPGDDWGLLRSALAGDAQAVARLRRLLADHCWTICQHLRHNDQQARAMVQEFLDAAMENDFAMLAGFDGRGRLGTFIILLVREFLAERVRRLISAAHPGAWADFAALFEQDLRRLIRRRLPGAAHETMREDLYQDIALGLVADQWSRVQDYTGKGSFGGFILQTADRLLIDGLRRHHGRTRAPRAQLRLSALAQEIYRLHQHEGIPTDPDLLLARLALQQPAPPERAAILAALAEVDALAATQSPPPGARRAEPLPETAPETMADTEGASPEESLLRAEDEGLLDGATAALRTAMAALTGPERAYLGIALGGGVPLPAREIARLMGEPVAEIYKLKQKLLPRLKAMLAESAAVKNWAASVLPG